MKEILMYIAVLVLIVCIFGIILHRFKENKYNSAKKCKEACGDVFKVEQYTNGKFLTCWCFKEPRIINIYKEAAEK